MTIKELAQFTGKTERTIRNWVSKSSEKFSALSEKISEAEKTKKPANFTIDEVEQILLNSTMSKDAVSIIMQNARRKNAVSENQTSTLTSRDIELISSIVSFTVAKTIEQLDGRMSRIENRIEERQALLPVKKDARAHITELVRDYAVKHDLSYNKVYSMLYREFGYRTHTNPSVSAINRHITTIEYICQSGKIGILESVAVDILK